ncbi:MAG: PAS domain S-box protein, partial [Planctomycetota bacterium]
SVGRALEHGAWVLFETTFLLWGVQAYRKQIYRASKLKVALKLKGETLETQIRERTAELRESEQFLSSIIDSIENEICIVDSKGDVIRTNAVWDKFATENGGQPGSSGNYFQACERASGPCASNAHVLSDAIKKVIHGKLDHYSDEYECHSPAALRWYQVTVSPIALDSGGGAVVCHTEITERVLAEKEKLKQKTYAEQLALVAKYTDNAVVITDADGSIEWVNEGFTRMTGYTLDEVINRRPGTFLQGEETDPETIAYMRECIREKKGFDVELINYDRNGRKYWIQLEVRPIHNDEGQVDKFIGMESDINERKKNEEILESLNEILNEHNRMVNEERQLLNTIVNGIPYGIYWKNRSHDYLGCNDTYVDFLNLEDISKVAGSTDIMLGMQDEIAQDQRLIETEVIEEGVEIRNREETHVDQEGHIRIIWRSVLPLVDDLGSVAGLVGVVMDVTEIKKAQTERNQLLNEAAELAAVIRSSPSEVFIFCQEDFHFVEVNQGACESTGYTAEELSLMTPLELKPEFTLESFTELVQPLSSGESSQIEFQTVHRRKDNTLYPVQIVLHKAEYRGRPVYVAFVSDITTVRSLEQQLSQAQKLESLGQLSAGIAHEINTPIQFVGDNIEFLSDASKRLFGVIDWCDQLIGEECGLSEDRLNELVDLRKKNRFEIIREQIPQAIDESREGIQRTVGILQAMKDLSHLENRERTSIDLNRAIESTVTVTRNRWKYAARLSTELAAELPTVRGFRAELNQVLLNLIVNAADAVAEKFGDGNLGDIKIRSSVDGDHVVVAVEDNGGGIPESIIQKIFDPFFTTKEVGKGTGQGLSLSHSVITQMHGGELLVSSEENTGSTFEIRLPIATENTEPIQLAEDSAAIGSTQPITIHSI